MTQHFCQVRLICCGSKSKHPPAIHEGDLGSIQERKISDQLHPVTLTWQGKGCHVVSEMR